MSNFVIKFFSFIFRWARGFQHSCCFCCLMPGLLTHRLRISETTKTNFWQKNRKNEMSDCCLCNVLSWNYVHKLNILNQLKRSYFYQRLQSFLILKHTQVAIFFQRTFFFCMSKKITHLALKNIFKSRYSSDCWQWFNERFYFYLSVLASSSVLEDSVDSSAFSFSELFSSSSSCSVKRRCKTSNH